MASESAPRRAPRLGYFCPCGSRRHRASHLAPGGRGAADPGSDYLRHPARSALASLRQGWATDRLRRALGPTISEVTAVGRCDEGDKMSVKLSSPALSSLPKTVGVPKYKRSDLKAGIFHIGVGNFHRAHQAVYLD